MKYVYLYTRSILKSDRYITMGTRVYTSAEKAEAEIKSFCKAINAHNLEFDRVDFGRDDLYEDTFTFDSITEQDGLNKYRITVTKTELL